MNTSQVLNLLSHSGNSSLVPSFPPHPAYGPTSSLPPQGVGLTLPGRLIIPQHHLPKGSFRSQLVPFLPGSKLPLLPRDRPAWSPHCSGGLASGLPVPVLFFFNLILLLLNEFITFYSCTMIITTQFYSISIPQPQCIPPPPTCLLWKP